MDAYYRSGTLLDHKQNADVAVEHAAKDGQKVDKVLVWQRYAGKYSRHTDGRRAGLLRQRPAEKLLRRPG
jgi:hypothetical protein